MQDGVGEVGGRLQGAAAADHEEDADVHALQGVRDFLDILGAAARSDHHTAAFVDVDHLVRGEVQHVIAVAGNEPAQAVAHAGNVAHTVAVVQLEHDRADDVVQPRAEPPAGDQGALELAGVEVDALARPGQLVGRRQGAVRKRFTGPVHGDVDQDPVLLGYEAETVGAVYALVHGGRYPGIPQCRDVRVGRFRWYVHNLIIIPETLSC